MLIEALYWRERKWGSAWEINLQGFRVVDQVAKGMEVLLDFEPDFSRESYSVKACLY